eukprot:361947-Chlamydomonas_euryale.AAC.3
MHIVSTLALVHGARIRAAVGLEDGHGKALGKQQGRWLGEWVDRAQVCAMHGHMCGCIRKID